MDITNDGKFTCTLAGVYKFDVAILSGGMIRNIFVDLCIINTGGTGTPNAIAKSQSDYNGSGNLDYTHCGFSVIYPC